MKIDIRYKETYKIAKIAGIVGNIKMHEHAAMTSSNEDWAHQIDAIYKAEGQIESVTIEHRNITINVVDNKNVLIRFMYSYGMEETRAFDKQELQQLIELLNKIESQME